MSALREAMEEDPRLTVLRRILGELDDSGANAILLHGNGDDLPDVRSDVDLAFDRPPPRVMEPVLRKLADVGMFSIIQRLHYEIPHGYYYILRTPGVPPRFLHLDCLYDPLGVNRYHLPTPMLSEGALRGHMTKRTAKEAEALYLLMKRAIKGNVSQTSLQALQRTVSEMDDAWHSRLSTWFGHNAALHLANLLAAKDPVDAKPYLAKLRADADETFRYRHPLRWFKALIRDAMRKSRRFVHPTGLFVVIIGPDGAGKSTVADMLLVQLERAFRRTWRFHWRPGLLPKLSRRARQSISVAGSAASMESSRYGRIVSFARFLYYWLDFVLGYWLVIYPRKARTTLVVGERYFPDVLVHPQRYAFYLPNWVMRAAATLVPSPDLLILLKDDPDVIYDRKAELTRAEIARQIEAYESETTRWRKSAVLTTEGGVEAVVARVANVVLNESARRTESTSSVADRRLQWRAFPSATRPKIWSNDGDTFAHALNLLHPYSTIGRLAKSFIGALPDVAVRCAFQARPDRSLATRLRITSRIIRSVLGDDALIVSFCEGTSGPHRKLTGQATRDGSVVSYVKIAESKTVSELLTHEAAMLAWLDVQGFRGAEVPRVIALEHRDELSLLFLTPPATPGRQRPPQPDELDLRFLCSLAALNAGTVPLMQYLCRSGIASYVERVRVRYPDAAAVLDQAISAVPRLLGDMVKVAPCHGDYAPWNTLEVEGRKHYVFDWEYARKEAGALHDAFHRVVMPGRLLSKEQPSESVDRALDGQRNVLLGRVAAHLEVAKAELPAYLILYLLWRLAHDPRDDPDPFLTQMILCASSRAEAGGPRRRVLVAAYACEPDRGSEPGVGWRNCQAISVEHEAWVITRANNRKAIETELAKRPNRNLHFQYVDLPRWMAFWKRRGRGIRLYYYLWQFAALREALKLVSKVKFDAAHHVTFVNDYLFTFLAFVPVPFVWGPIGSNCSMPSSLVGGTRAWLEDRVRHGVKVLLRAGDPLFWLTAVRARLVVGASRKVVNGFPLSLLARRKFRSHLAIGVEQEFLATPRVRRRSAEPFEVLSMGQLVSIKAFHLTLHAFASFADREPSARLTIVGDGPLKRALERLAVDLGVATRVAFVPWLPRAQALDFMRDAHAYLFPSFESAGMVVLEAMAHGLPVVCLQQTGPGEMVSEGGGFAIPMGPLRDTIHALADALHALARDEQLRLRTGADARRVVQRKYLWEDRYKILREWYAGASIANETAARGSAQEAGKS